MLQLGLTVLSNLAATADGAAFLLKSPLLSKTEQQLHHSLQRREGPRTTALLGPLINLAVHSEGQKQILRAASAPGLKPPPPCMHCNPSRNKPLLRLQMLRLSKVVTLLGFSQHTGGLGISWQITAGSCYVTSCPSFCTMTLCFTSHLGSLS